MKVLIAVDATPSCQGVVQAAAARPWPAGSSFLLATAIAPFFFARAPALLDQARSTHANTWNTRPKHFNPRDGR